MPGGRDALSAIVYRAVVQRTSETTLGLPAVDEEHHHGDYDQARTDVDERGIAPVAEPRCSTYSHERPDDDGNDGQDISQRVELEPPEPPRYLLAFGTILSHGNSVSDQ
jgi:hypothetical protein